MFLIVLPFIVAAMHIFEQQPGGGNQPAERFQRIELHTLLIFPGRVIPSGGKDDVLLHITVFDPAGFVNQIIPVLT
ncbi:hypothetical protein D3C80_2068380 [compost metagenome]